MPAVKYKVKSNIEYAREYVSEYIQYTAVKFQCCHE